MQPLHKNSVPALALQPDGNIWNILQDYLSLCKPRVVLLMLLTSWVGMHIASNAHTPWRVFFYCSLGIALCGGSAAAINHLIDRHIDRKMQRTSSRPIASHRIKPVEALSFASILGVLGITILIKFVNPLSAWLTFATLIGYALVYTLYLKRATPQNIVIGGLAGATPPLLGWAAVSNDIHPHALLLVLIIFVWTPPHFWALAIYREKDYRNAKIPMLPITHGVHFTKLCIVLYTVLLFAITLLPFATHMSGVFYCISACVLNSIFLYYAIKLYLNDNIAIALHTFNYSIMYLMFLFASLLIDHYLALAGA